MTPGDALDCGLRELGLGVPDEAKSRMLAFIRLLEKWNRTFNLTAIREPSKMVSHHLLDCLSVVPHLPLGPGERLADVGSGGGLPGIPIALAQPAWQVTLNESNSKKAAFLRQAAIELRLANVEVVEARVQDWHPQLPFKVVISRAFAEVSAFFEACRHLIADGVLACMKGQHPRLELQHLPAGCTCGEVIRLEVPMLGAERHLVMCRKAAA